MKEGPDISIVAALIGNPACANMLMALLAGPALTATELDGRIEDWFARRWEAVFDFEVDDGVGKLRRLCLVDEDGQGRLTAVTLDEAKRRLDELWDNLFVYNAPRRTAEP